jgi:hypothetical protein
MSRRTKLRQEPREEYPCQRTIWFLHALREMESPLIQTWLTADGARFLRARTLLPKMVLSFQLGRAASFKAHVDGWIEDVSGFQATWLNF